MKNLDLNKYGVQEMNAGEMRENNGGFFWTAVLIISAISAVAYAISLKTQSGSRR